MKLTLVALTLLLSVTLARADTKGADTKSVLDVRAMTLNRSSANSVTTGIGPGASSRRAKDAPTADTSSPQDHLTR
jgi:hypothetical protein